MYDKYAAVYDQSRQDRFSKRMVPYIQQLWGRLKATPKSLLDLGCGTGVAAIAFARQGIQVTGVDLSEAMLAQAQKKRQARLVDWQQGDMRSLKLSQRFEAAICLYDSLNYMLTPTEFEAALYGVANHLAPGGLFIFDLVTEHALSQEWGNETEILPDDDLYQIWQSRYDPESRCARMQLTLFHRMGETYQRIEETHHHRTIDRAEVDHALEGCGFQLVGTYEAFTQHPPKEDAYRIVYVARRRAIQLAPRGGMMK